MTSTLGAEPLTGEGMQLRLAHPTDLSQPRNRSWYAEDAHAWKSPAETTVKWRSESLGWYDGRQLVGAGQPQFTYEIPLRDPDGESRTDLLRGMNQLWRRNIKKAAKEGVEVTVGADLKAFHDLYVHTAERDRFTPRPLRYFETMFAALRYVGEWDLPLRPMVYRAFDPLHEAARAHETARAIMSRR